MKRNLFLILFFYFSPVWAEWQVHYGHLPDTLKTPLLLQFPDLKNKKIGRAEMDEVIRWIHNHLEIDRVSFVEDSAGQVRLEVQKIPRIAQIHFSGLSALTESEARSYVLLNIGDTYDEQLLLDSGERLRQGYKDLGYLNAEIDVELPTNEKGQLLLNFSVRENPRTEIKSITIESNEDLKTTLNPIARKYKDKPFTEITLGEIQQSLREKLNKEGHYLAEIIGPEARFNADETQAHLVYRFDKVEKFIIELKGNSAMTSDTLFDKALHLEDYNSANPNIAAELVQRLRTYYLQEGHARVEIQSSEAEGRTPNTRRLNLIIDEGAKIKVEKYVLGGKFSRSEDFYAEFIRKNSSPLVKKGFYNKDDMDKGFANLITHLRNQGHLLSKIVSSRISYNRTKDKVTIYVNLDEGPVTLVDSIEFIGNTSFSPAELVDLLDLEPRQPLKLNQLEEGIQEIKNFYFENGYIEMILLNEREDLVIYNEDNTKAKLRFKIFEGPKVIVNSIVIDGNHFTKDYVILNEILLEVGDIVTPEKIEESKSRLQRAGHFGSVEIRTLEEKTNVSQRTLIVRVTEREPGIFTMGFGVTNERNLTLRGYTGIDYRNLWGTGRGISLRLEGNYNVADVKYLENKVTVGYLEPYLFNTRNRGRANISRSKTVSDYELRRISEVNQAIWSVERDLNRHILGIWELINIATVRDFSLDESDNYDVLTNIASTGPTFNFDYKDNIFNPTKGFQARLNAEWGSPELGSSPGIRYWRGTSSFTTYTTVAPGPWIWDNSFRLGFLENLSSLGDGGVPYDKKGFILGGQSTIRGYEAGTSEVFPSRRDLGSGDSQYTLTTRAKMALFKSEMTFPIWGPVAGAVFYDGGYVEVEQLRFIDYYRDSFGLGVRYNTPVGPLKLDFAWKLDRREGEEIGRFHLSIGRF